MAVQCFYEEPNFDIRLFNVDYKKLTLPQRIDFIITFNGKTIIINTVVVFNKRHSANIRRANGFQNVPVISLSLLCTETFEVLSTSALLLDTYDIKDRSGDSDYHSHSISFFIYSDYLRKRFDSTDNKSF
ncbi:hypothetical protein [Photobacterium iliopiscarium]|uniref:Uncharacterized protein n=1 Tax=Photobacterium iliopiscarium TaxID=56192 RepID=A0A2T3MN72_9GAMM|nr:hypothetical protein [Photobacterium iliopiscarium]PSV98200.1 hypothetical protein C9I88_05915 [Photobacterium iliopiscarium]